MDYTQVLCDILHNGTNVLFQLQKIPFCLQPGFCIHWLNAACHQLVFSVLSKAALGMYDEVLLEPGRQFCSPLRKRHSNFLIQEDMQRNDLLAAVSKSNSVLGCIREDFSSRSSEDCFCVSQYACIVPGSSPRQHNPIAYTEKLLEWSLA